jgi:hypothetical protein
MKCVVTYISPIPLQFEIICQGEEVNVGLREDLEIASALREVGDELDRLGPRVSELQERRQGGLEAGSCGLITDCAMLAPEQDEQQG